MSYEIHGHQLDTLLLQSASTLVTNKDDISEFTATWVCHRDSLADLIPEIGDETDQFENLYPTPGLFIVEREVRFEEPCLAFITAKFKGQLGVEFALPPPPKYSLQRSSMERPIQLHPKFLDESVFPESTKAFIEVVDKDGLTIKTFDRFKDNDPDSAKCKFRGVESYLVQTGRFREQSYSRTEPGEELYREKMKIVTPSRLKNATPGHWLQTEASAEKEGRFWVIDREWLYSGADTPWLKELYT